jgi:hypothetical protein
MPTIVSRITFNTGRMYDQDGQIITAVLYDDGKVIFDDSSRHIWGEFQTKDVDFVKAWWPTRPEAFATAVMRRYDTYEYQMGRGRLTRESIIHKFRL